MKQEFRQWIDGKWTLLNSEESVLEQARDIAERVLTESCSVVFINIANGKPQAKAMFPKLREGLSVLWFNTDATSKRLQQITVDPISTVYAFDAQRVEGIMLSRMSFVETDPEQRKRAWETSNIDYKDGVDDPDFQVIRFEIEEINCFFDGNSVTF